MRNNSYQLFGSCTDPAWKHSFIKTCCFTWHVKCSTISGIASIKVYCTILARRMEERLYNEGKRKRELFQRSGGWTRWRPEPSPSDGGLPGWVLAPRSSPSCLPSGGTAASSRPRCTRRECWSSSYRWSRTGSDRSAGLGGSKDDTVITRRWLVSQMFLLVSGYPSRWTGHAEVKAGSQQQRHASRLYMAAVSPEALERDFPWHGMETSTFTCLAPLLRQSLYERPFSKPQWAPFQGRFYFGLVNEDENSCPWS